MSHQDPGVDSCNGTDRDQETPRIMGKLREVPKRRPGECFEEQKEPDALREQPPHQRVHFNFDAEQADEISRRDGIGNVRDEKERDHPVVKIMERRFGDFHFPMMSPYLLFSTLQRNF